MKSGTILAHSHKLLSPSKEKPEKPYPDFPLFAHDNGQWCKKILGKHHFFGVWSDPQAAVDLYEHQREALYSGRTPTKLRANATIDYAVNAFLNSKKKLLDTGALSQRSYDDYFVTCERIIKEFGRTRKLSSLTVADFEDLRAALAKRFGPVALGNDINRVRIIFKYAWESRLIDTPVHFGPDFKRPSAKTLRLEKSNRGKRAFTAPELNAVLKKAKEPLKTMVRLGINCGLGNADIGRLSVDHLDLDGGWLNYPRPKTGMDRRAKLWPETVLGLIKAIKARADSDVHPGLVFVTSRNNQWCDGEPGSHLSHKFIQLLTAAGVRRPGLNFYALRHTFQTIGDESKDHPAVRAIMGHVPPPNDMSSVYREHISDARLEAVSEHVKKWLKVSKTGVEIKKQRKTSRQKAC